MKRRQSALGGNPSNLFGNESEEIENKIEQEFDRVTKALALTEQDVNLN